MNKKGLTLIELIITIALVSVIMVFLYKLLATVSFESKSEYIDTADREVRAEIIRTIQDTLVDHNSVDGNTGVYIATYKASDKSISICPPGGCSSAVPYFIIELKEDADGKQKFSFYKNTSSGKELLQSWKLRNGTFEEINANTCKNDTISWNEGVSSKTLNLMNCNFRVFTDNFDNKIINPGINSNNTLDDVIITLTNYNKVQKEEPVAGGGEEEVPGSTSIFALNDSFSTISWDKVKEVIEQYKANYTDTSNEYVNFYINGFKVGDKRTITYNEYKSFVSTNYGDIELTLANKTACTNSSSKRTDCGLVVIGKTTNPPKIVLNQESYGTAYGSTFSTAFTDYENIISNISHLPLVSVDVPFGISFVSSDEENERYETLPNQKIYLLSTAEVVEDYCNMPSAPNGICYMETRQRALDYFANIAYNENTWLRDIDTSKGTVSSNGYVYDYLNGDEIILRPASKGNTTRYEYIFAFRLL